MHLTGLTYLDSSKLCSKLPVCMLFSSQDIERILLDSAKEELISIKPRVRNKPPAIKPHVSNKLPSAPPQPHTNPRLRTYKPTVYKPLHSVPTTVNKIQSLIRTQETPTDEVCEDEELTIPEENPSNEESVKEDSVEDSVVSEDSLSGSSDGYMKSVEHVLSDIGTVYALESLVTHMELGYTGTFDCLAEYK